MSLNVKRFFEKARSEKGQGLVEYALILVLIALVVMAAIQTVGKTTSNTFVNISNGLEKPGQ